MRSLSQTAACHSTDFRDNSKPSRPGDTLLQHPPAQQYPPAYLENSTPDHRHRHIGTFCHSPLLSPAFAGTRPCNRQASVSFRRTALRRSPPLHNILPPHNPAPSADSFPVDCSFGPLSVPIPGRYLLPCSFGSMPFQTWTNNQKHPPSCFPQAIFLPPLLFQVFSE